jgi:hypothetical protein
MCIDQRTCGMIMAGETVEVIRPHPFERGGEGGMVAPARHLWQFSVGDLLEQRVREGIGHICAGEILDHESNRVEAAYGFQENPVVQATDPLQNVMRYGLSADRDQIEYPALSCVQVLQALQDEISYTRREERRQVGLQDPAAVIVSEMTSFNEGADERFDEERRATSAGVEQGE